MRSRRFILTLLVALPALLALSGNAQAFTRSPLIDRTIQHFDKLEGNNYTARYARCLSAGETARNLASGGPLDETSVITRDGKWLKPGGYITLTTGVCQNIVGAIAQTGSYLGGAANNASAAQQFLLLTHEIGHTLDKSWWTNEALTECWAIRHVSQVMTYLGLPPAKVSLMFRWAKLENTRWPVKYHDPSCIIPLEA